MDLLSRPEGYTNHQMAYQSPIPFIPTPKTLHDKRDTTLLEMTMKASLRQRLSGVFHNYSRDKTYNNYHLDYRQKSITSRTAISASFQNIKQRQRQKNIQARIKNINYSALSQKHPQTSIQKANSRKYQFEPVLSKGSSIYLKSKLSQMGSSIDLESNKGYEEKSKINSKRQMTNKNSKDGCISQRGKSQMQIQEQKQNKTSFISAIEDGFQRQALNNQSPPPVHKIRLPYISDKRRNLSFKQQVVRNPKVVFKKQLDIKVTVDEDFWHSVSRNKDQKPNWIKQRLNNYKKTTAINQQAIQPLKETQEPYTINLQNQYSIHPSKNIGVTKPDDNSFLNKEAIINLMNNQRLAVPFFMNSIFIFFELSNKVHDKMKKKQFENALSYIYSLSDRAWCVAVFRLFDSNKDGRIDHSDLFKIHNSLDQIRSIIDSTIAEDNFKQKRTNSYKLTVQPQINSAVPSRTTRQKTNSSQVTVYENNQKQKVQRKSRKRPQMKNKATESVHQDEGKSIGANNPILKNLENVKKLQNQIINLNHKITLKNKSNKNNTQFVNTDAIQLKGEAKQEDIQIYSGYLEQALLKKQDLKFSDLSLILNEHPNKRAEIKKKVIDIDLKKLNIKLSSPYVQTFSATDHNQQTRMNRQYVQSLKDYIKNQSHQIRKHDHSLEAKVLPSVGYAEFFQRKLFLPLKSLFFTFIHAQVVQAK